jgi:hypothetical protein
MEKFDEIIRDAKQEYNPKKNITENIMKEISTRKKPRKSLATKILGSSLAGGVVVALFIILALPVLNNRSNTTPSSPVSQPKTSSSQSVTPPAGTDDTSLNNDLDGINSSMNQESSDQGNADSSINDSSQEITVPSS